MQGGLDVGGTKIEARLFSQSWETVELRRIATPTDNLADFIDALGQQVRWLQQRSGLATALPVGIALPGLVDPATGIAFTSNLPITGQDVGALLSTHIGRRLPIMNDCQAFALSESNGGAGDGFNTVVGLIMGTGVGAGLCVGSKLTQRLNGSALEVGHVGVPARTLLPLNLPVWSCGCGKQGCFERYVSGSGLAAVGQHRIGHRWQAEEIVSGAAAGDVLAISIMSDWAAIAAELLLDIQINHDPDCIVIGGGLSAIPGILDILGKALSAIPLGTMRPPVLKLAIHGDSSGARGAAILADGAAAARASEAYK
jgi:N-acetylglucosamine kinase